MPDERLALIFTCCHPGLAEPARVALTLHTLGGLTTTEIAAAFLVPETTMAQRLVRAKRKIKAANSPYRVPPPSLWPERLESVLKVIYFIFNEGYSASSGSQLIRNELCREAIRLGRQLVQLVPQEAEVAGLCALMLLHDSRRDARISDDGQFVPLEHHDRSSWNREYIVEGKTLLQRALAMRRAGPYQIQAAISALHTDAASHGQTDRRQIVGLYERFYDFQPSSVVRLNQIVAISFAEGVDAGLMAMEQLEDRTVLDRYHPYHAAPCRSVASSGTQD